MLNPHRDAASRFPRDAAIVCFSHLRWDFVFQRPQHIMSRFARERPVFFIEEPLISISAPHELYQYEITSEGVHRVVPLARDRMQDALNGVVERFELRRFVSWYYTPAAFAFSGHLNPNAVVYDCMDQLSAFKGADPRLSTLEFQLLGAADAVYAGGRSSYESKRTRHENIHLLPSSVDQEHFRKARNNKLERMEHAKIPRPRAGYYGVIDERLDLDLLESFHDSGTSIISANSRTKSSRRFLRVGTLRFSRSRAMQRRVSSVRRKSWKSLQLPTIRNPSARRSTPREAEKRTRSGMPRWSRFCNRRRGIERGRPWMRQSAASSDKIELWGGVEPTVNRVGDTYHDQGRRCGFWSRPSDIDRFAKLGITALRFPILWERVERRRGAYRFDDVARRLDRLEKFGIRPIATLLHHGSGPAWTSLLDPDFPKLFAEYAERVAQRFPQIGAYTPVNEPLTTARFSALYGHWYPHHRDDRSFVRALLNQLWGTVLAMRAIRSTSLRAQLIVTEDIGTTHATPRLRYQADFENERRWLPFDLLSGRLNDESMMWRWMTQRGMTDAEASAFVASGVEPDIYGVNYYVTSERWLDHRLKLYPVDVHGGNGIDGYADVEAVRARREGIAGWDGALRETWSRYRRPIAITEVHIGAEEDEQVRWLWEAWCAAQSARRAGIDVRAVTVWSLLGAYDWCSLVTTIRNIYEPGPFDVRSGKVRPTALAEMMSALAAGTPFAHPALALPGWWRRPDRFFEMLLAC